MNPLMPLASALGLGMLAGARLYATVFVLGLLLRFDWVTLPASWQHASVLADTRILILSGIACVIEFIADKIPWLDSAWDSVHTFIRPIGAALVASSLFSNLDPVYQVGLFLLAGGMAFSAHSAKAAARLAVNHSPEPFSNLALSFGEDALVAVGLYLLVKHPWITGGIAIAMLALSAWLAPKMFRAIRAEWAALAARLRHWFGSSHAPRLTERQREALAKSGRGNSPRAVLSVIATGDLKGLRNARGALCLFDNDAMFLTRRWARPVERRVGPFVSIEASKGLLVDKLALLNSDRSRVRFDLLAGQVEQLLAESARYSPPSSAA
jgi:Domain of unknown function (DUF4126)